MPKKKVRRSSKKAKRVVPAKTKAVRKTKFVRRIKKPIKSQDRSIASRRKINLVLRNLMASFALFLASFLLSEILAGDMMKNLFTFLAIIFLALSLLFLIIFFALIVSRFIKR
jgi:hypothetical protein